MPTYDRASTEPLEIIRVNECETDVGSLATNRFRALWNEIERLRSGVERIHAALENPATPRQSIGEMADALLNPKK